MEKKINLDSISLKKSDQQEEPTSKRVLISPQGGLQDPTLQGQSTEGQLQQSEGFVTDPQIAGKQQFIYRPNDVARQGLDQKSKHIYHIDKAKLPNNFDSPFAPLPGSVEFGRIVANVMANIQDALKLKKSEEIMNNTTSNMDDKKVKRREGRYEKWHKYLQLNENLAIVSDSFWYAICQFKLKQIKKKEQSAEEKEKDMIQDPKHHVEEEKKVDPDDKLYTELEIQDIIENLLNRISRNYVNLMLSIEDEADNEAFFKRYFDIIAQSVFYSFFYAFPKSRSQFNDELKKSLIDDFSYQFTGVPISNSNKYWDKWNLDLGAGNILKKDKEKLIQKDQNDKQKGNSLPAIPQKGNYSLRNKRNLMNIRFSPIIERYITKYKYKTRNYIQWFKMKFTEYDKNQDKIEQHFNGYMKISDQIKRTSKHWLKDNDDARNKMEKEIKDFKKETVKHHRRLEKRKAEELERGAHEYANYLVSMLNAGLSMANLGVTNQKGLF